MAQTTTQAHNRELHTAARLGFVLERSPGIRRDSTTNMTYKNATLSYTLMQISTTPTVNATFIIGVNLNLYNGTQQLPVVIVIHGTGQSCWQWMNLGYLHPYAYAGHLTACMDQRFHGNRTYPLMNDATNAKGPYFDALNQSWITGKSYPYVYSNALDVTRFVDYLVSRPDVNTAKIGLTGASSGGNSGWKGALIDPRIQVIAPAVAVEWTRNSTEHGLWYDRVWSIRPPFLQAAWEIQGLSPSLFTSMANLSLISPEVIAKVWSRINPGSLDEFDTPSILPSLSPRALFCLAAQNDTRNGSPDVVNLVLQMVQNQYAKDNAASNFTTYVRPNQPHGQWPGEQDQIAAYFTSKFLT
eukprot:TRINITY_DN4909_c0_g1_i2.p1 TRINITY_DN4909_c0_g1~~TRINITY_DN4909_c0_g1_i2.p1  ORF type:complete len:356 (+),score=62.94 TRINITY_DN4909_c0_g1_i2:297-1364(+)